MQVCCCVVLSVQMCSMCTYTSVLVCDMCIHASVQVCGGEHVRVVFYLGYWGLNLGPHAC